MSNTGSPWSEYMRSDAAKDELAAEAGSPAPSSPSVEAAANRERKAAFPRFEDYPPLDITVAARSIEQIFRLALHELERCNGNIYIPIGGEVAKVGDRIIEVLQQLDEGRTRALHFYRTQLMEAQSVMLRPAVIMAQPMPESDTKDPVARTQEGVL